VGDRLSTVQSGAIVSPPEVFAVCCLGGCCVGCCADVSAGVRVQVHVWSHMPTGLLRAADRAPWGSPLQLLLHSPLTSVHTCQHYVSHSTDCRARLTTHRAAACSRRSQHLWHMYMCRTSETVAADGQRTVWVAVRPTQSSGAGPAEGVVQSHAGLLPCTSLAGSQPQEQGGQAAVAAMCGGCVVWVVHMLLRSRSSSVCQQHCDHATLFGDAVQVHGS
jgi:hypothetical protein